MRKLLFLFLYLIGTQQAFSQWNNNTTINNLVANPAQSNSQSWCVTDGSGGSIIIFSSDDDIYAQKISSAGNISWGSTSAPVLICNAINGQNFDNAIADGAGGAFIVWDDFRHDLDNGEIYMQQVNSAGVALWAANGIRVTNTPNNNDFSGYLCTDGSGGVIVYWNWDNNVNNTQTAAQRYNGAGVAQWTANGVAVSSSPGFRLGTGIVSDGASGAILFFMDSRDDLNGTDYDFLINNDIINLNIYAQRLNGSGVRLWTNNGVAVCTATSNQYDNGLNTAVSDGSGGAIYLFGDRRDDIPDMNGDPTNVDLYAQKLNSSGVAQWAANGVPVTRAAGNQVEESIASDGAGGIVASWQNESNPRIYSQKIISSGTANWTLNGILISPASSVSHDARLIADGAGNFIYGFLTDFGSETRLLAQKVNATGALQWGVNSAAVCNNTAGISALPAIVLSDNSGAILSWADSRNIATGLDIFASKMLSSGILAGGSTSMFISTANGNWNNPATWVGGVVPSATAQVTVRHSVTVSASTTCKSLRVEQPAGNVIVNTGIKLTITN
ncbi:MAG: hypothetical protein ABI760_10775 [Ferruginibacter sp.]